jgi:hypothetical protein
MRGDMLQRRRRDQRQKVPKPIRLTDRDKWIVYTVHQYRVLRQDQLERLFNRSSSVMQRVMVRLYDHGFLERKFLPILGWNSPTLYVLDRKGAELLRTEFGLEDLVWYNSSKDLKMEFLEHTTSINDVRIALTKAAEAAGYDLRKWVTETELKGNYDRVKVRIASGGLQSVSLIPDSYIVLKVPQGYAHFFLELDRGTETIGRFKSKILAYTAYYQSGAYERRYNSKSMRVLTVTSSVKRLENLKKATEEAGGKRRFWFAIQNTISTDSILHAPIWYVAGEQAKSQLLEVG